MRLFRLGRVARALHRFLESSFALLFLMLSFYMVVAHWFACVWYVIGMEDLKTGTVKSRCRGQYLADQLNLSQSVSNKRFHQCSNHKKKLSLRHPLPTFGNFSFFQASLWLRVDKVHWKLTKSWKSEYRQVFQCCILIPRKCPCKTLFQHTVSPPLHSKSYLHLCYQRPR